jgi:hypothetical protein
MATWSPEKSRSETVTLNGKTVDKSEIYPWVIMDQSGELMWIHKSNLKVNSKYQRQPNGGKIALITKEFWWVGFNTLTVARRGGKYWVIDGQHRLEAVLRLSKIQDVPCIVFDLEHIKQEAFAFLLANAGRKPVTVIEKHNAAICSGDQTAIFIQKSIESNGLVINKHGSAGTIAALAMCYRLAKIDKTAFAAVLRLCTRVCNESDMNVSERMLLGLWFVVCRSEDGGLACERLVDTIFKRGGRRLLDAAIRASAFYKKGGETVWGKAMCDELNTGLQKKLKFKGVE